MDKQKKQLVGNIMLSNTIFAGRYRIIRLIKQGRAANIYLAEDTRLLRPVALKIVTVDRPDYARTVADSVLRPGRILANLKHPNLLEVYDCKLTASEGYLVMPYAEGGTLVELLERQNKGLPFFQARHYFMQILLALKYLHHQNMVHGDLQPENLLFGNGQLVVGGLGKAVTSKLKNKPTLRDIIKNPLYSAPEGWNGVIGEATDVYALGLIFYQMLTGELPFDAPRVEALAEQHRSAALPLLAERRPDLPHGLQAFLEKLTAKKALERPSTSAIERLLVEALVEVKGKNRGADTALLINQIRGFLFLPGRAARQQPSYCAAYESEPSLYSNLQLWG